ncbi:Heterokaryon incompatibility protein 6 [Metarhizium guizhouense ARSEF 977]|uniref:Heterokaryon incompatibility protein 6 n=1 Tax=Metarhizium guizhouense (strain ARSEF 977) TaxID=1276136 RepID=A0A0B4GFC4_METGA|nr:Heterokaryon incompatibility protein 6 [Metarhizium guizhouense ARSEF 977]
MELSTRFASPPDYQYPALDASKREFRLIRLLTPKPSLIPGCQGTLRVEIIETTTRVESGETCSYNTLSYAWGNVSNRPQRTVLVEDRGKTYKLAIYRPLEVALLHLVATSVLDLPLFVDQICINQGDTNEKAHQVALMKDIYKNCERGIIWLGAASRNSDTWYNYVRERCHDGNGVLCGIINHRLASCMNVFDAVMDLSMEVSDQECEDRDAILDMIRLHGDDFPLAGYEDILDRRWFQRLWTIQEGCLPRQLLLACGMQSLCFDCFKAGMFFYSLYNAHWNKNHSGLKSREELKRRFMLLRNANAFGRVMQERRAIHGSNDQKSLYDIVLRYNVNDLEPKIGASMGEDRIFALLGLAADDDEFRKGVCVQYGGTMRTYRDIARLMLKQDVDTLLFNQFPKNLAGLPSWVPDWSMNLVTPLGYSKLTEPEFTAGGEKQTADLSLDEQNCLAIKGTLLDKVVFVGERTYSVSRESFMHPQIDYLDATLFFNEISGVVRDAASVYNGHSALPLDQEARALQFLRVCDSGLSYWSLAREFGHSEAKERLETCFYVVKFVGESAIKSEESLAAWSITRIYHTIGVVPWYFQAGSEMETLRYWARGPIAMGKLLYEGVQDFLWEMLMLCASSAMLQGISWYIDFRRRFRKIDYKAHKDLTKGPKMPEEWVTKLEQYAAERHSFMHHLVRNAGRRVYRTERGYVGMGPPKIECGDMVAVFHGGTMAHILRPSKDDRGHNKDTAWEYIGETYCDGIMHGEALESGVTRRVLLV